MTRSAEPRVLQFCHGYDGPFLDCARQYASLFAGTPYKVTTVFLTGRSDPEVAARCASDEVLFLEYGSRDIRGLKLKAIRDLREIARSRDFRFCIAHRFKPIWIASLATRLPIVGVHHAFGDYQRLSRKVFAGLMSKRLSLLAVSDAVRDDIRRCLPKWPAERIETLYNRIDVAALQAEQVERLSARRQLRLPDEAWVVGNVGRLHPDKDQATLLRGFAAALPRLPQNSLLEAMVAGVPLIATACGGAREVVEGVGILFPLGDETALAEGLTHLAALDRRQREACARLMLERLETRFSDAAVRREFWRLPTIAGFASESAC
ncbi:glycosyltransferase [Pseudomonas aeruginosa]|uniref:glycosyltransferase n=1 Tax=Pseudomonas aeruginosa TaxID=287 RepID=UPI001248D58A|nr:glycosyltransferase [Pseudomonas aeruginosa]KAB0704111.1 glycosyltransferase [Pseudomonas aeruginosa]